MDDNDRAHRHEFVTVGKRSGSRVRYVCSTCPKLGPWVRLVADDRPPADPKDMNVTQLRALAKAQGQSGYSKMKRDDLLAMLLGGGYGR